MSVSLERSSSPGCWPHGWRLSLFLALRGSSGPPRQGVGLAGGGFLSLALPGSSGTHRQARECVILSAPEELPTSEILLSKLTKLAMVNFKIVYRMSWSTRFL